MDEDIQFETKERHQIYYEVLNLPLKHRTIIHLFYYEDLKLDEIADILNISKSNAKTRLFRARQELKTNLEGGFDDE